MDNMIGQRIRARRKELHITQTQIQKQTSISSGNLSGIENGRYLPSAVALIELSSILECSIDWILTGDSLKSNIIDSNENQQDALLMQYFHAMSEDDREELLMIAEMKYKKKERQYNNIND